MLPQRIDFSSFLTNLLLQNAWLKDNQRLLLIVPSSMLKNISWLHLVLRHFFFRKTWRIWKIYRIIWLNKISALKSQQPEVRAKCSLELYQWPPHLPCSSSVQCHYCEAHLTIFVGEGRKWTRGPLLSEWHITWWRWSAKQSQTLRWTSFSPCRVL